MKVLKKENCENSSKINNIKFHILVIICISIFCASICPVTLQNDTYYTIKIGEEIFKENKIDMQDAFSWHKLPYTYPHWAYDIIIYLIFNFAGFKGIFISTIIFAIILGIIMYFTNVKISNNKSISFIITLGTMFLLKKYIAARAQLVTFILFELEILLIENFLGTNKRMARLKNGLGLIVISILIANLHCAVWPFFFILFLPYIGEYLIFKVVDDNIIHKFINSYYSKLNVFYSNKLKKQKDKDNKIKYENKIEGLKRKKDEENKKFDRILIKRKERRKNPYRIRYNMNKNVKWLIILMIICTLTGLITPVGDTPYTYLYKTMKGNTTDSISEHLPLVLINNKEIMLVLIAILMILIFTDTKIRLKDLFMFCGLTLLMIMTRRQESMLLIFGSAVVTKLISELFYKYDKDGMQRLEKNITSFLGIVFTASIVFIVSLVNVKPKLKHKIVNESIYPVSAAKYIKDNLDLNNMRLFNEYNYGSYLLYEGIPVFIDSRADLYTPEFNGNKNKDGKYEGKDIFTDYIKTSNLSRYYENTFDKYAITHVILYKNSRLNMFLSRDNNYEKLYSDKRFVIYERKI